MMSVAAEPSHRRILFCIYSHNIWGGIEFWVTRLSRFLVKRGWDVQFGLARGARFNDPANFKRAFPEIDAVEFDGRTGTPDGRVRAISSVLRELRPDIVVPIGLGDVFHAAAKLREEGHPFRLLAPLRATSPELFQEIATFAPVIDMCVGNNPLHARFLAERAIFPPDRLRTIVNGVDLPALERPLIKEAKPASRLLFVGRLHLLHKRILDQVVLVHELDRRGIPFTLTVVGDGEGKERFVEHLGERLRRESIHILGYLSPERIAREIYPHHDLLVHFSASEGCPQAVQQAMAHGVVPLCSEFLGFHSLRFLRDGDTCLSFPVGDVQLAADHVESLHRQPDKLLPLARAAQDAIQAFPMERMLLAWEQTLRDTLDLPSRAIEGQQQSILKPAQGQSRLDRLGIPPSAADWLRRTFRRFPDFPDGWAEWPGTLASLDPSARSAMLDELFRLDALARSSKGHAIAGT